MAEDQADDKRGYRKPPLKNRFQTGHSGNPGGRPKGKRTTADEFRRVLAMLVTIEEGGKKRKISTVHATFLQLRRAMLGGDAKARREFLALVDRYAPTEMQQGWSDMLVDDERLITELRAARPKGQDNDGHA